MVRFDSPESVTEVLAAPLGEVIAAVGRSVAEAQRALDAQALENFRALYADNSAAFAALRAIGYQPTWYHIPEATAEIAIAFTVTGSQVGTNRPRLGLYGAPVDAGYQSKFNYQLQASSSLKFRIVPVPTPSAATHLRIVPSLVDRTIAAARELLGELDIGLEVTVPDASDDNYVTSQEPAPGSTLPAGAMVLVTAIRAP